MEKKYTLKECVNELFGAKEVCLRKRYICQMLRLNGFEDDGSVDFSIDVPINANVFDSFEEAIDYGNSHIATVVVREMFWGEEYDYADDVQILCGYIVFETNIKTYHTYNGLPRDKRIVGERFCSPSFLIPLQKEYESGGQTKMFEVAKRIK